MPSPATLIHLDSPVEAPLASPFLVRGWIAANAPIESVRAGDADGPELDLVERADVRTHHPDYAHVVGFCGPAGAACVREGALHLSCRVRNHGVVAWEKLLPAPAPSPTKAARLARLRPHLRPDLPFTETVFHFDFLTPELRARFALDPTTAVSAFDYGPAVLDLIRQRPDGLILDAGAGLRRTELPNVINLEVAAYPSTDVLAANEQLPFRDDTFDAVISCAVLEHLKDPFAAARELVRVTRRGGLIYADVPFLQPFHGYPSHYYNMTSPGLVNLFQDTCEIQRTAVPDYGRPIWTLTWFLHRYVNALPPPAQETFRRMRVEDLLDHAERYLPLDFVRQLPEAANFELASVTSVWAVKK